MDDAWGAPLGPKHPALSWSGRIDQQAEFAAFDWAQSTLRARFEGTALQLSLDPGDNNLDLRVDGELKGILGAPPRDKALPNYGLWIKPDDFHPKTWVLRGLKPGTHLLELVKRTGANFGPVKFYGLRFNAAGRALEAPALPSRRLEFIGDSLTNGYGAEGVSKTCAELRPFENSGRSYAALTAAELKAEPQLIALSGFGVVRNYGDKERHSKDPLPFYYGRTLQGSAEPVWDRAKFKPDAVVLFLGNNDYSTEPHPDLKDFLKGFDDLVLAAMKGRPKTPLFVVTLKGREAQEKAIAEAFKRCKAKGLDVTLIVFEAAAETELGCDWHPKVVVHERWAKNLTAAITSRLAW